MDTSVDRTLTPAEMAERTGVIDHKLDIYRSALSLKGTP
jgi:hypothetical protein